MKSYPKYKDSGVEWLGEIPAHWFKYPFWYYFRRVVRKNHPENELLSVYRDFGVIKKSSRDDNFNVPSEDLSSYQLVEKRDLVINKMKAWQGSLGISNFTGIVSPAYFVFKPLQKMESNFINYLLRTNDYSSIFLAYSKGIRNDQWDLNSDLLRIVDILSPPLPEQKAIANFLDRETKKIDHLIEKQEQMIALLEEKRQALISHAVTKGLNPKAKMKDSGIEWLGEIPAHWEVKRLGKLSRIFRGASPRPAGSPLLFNGDFMPWITVAEITKDKEIYLTGTSSFLTKQGSLQSRLFRKGTLLLSNSGATLGVPKILDFDANANDGVVGFENLSKHFDIIYCYYFLETITENLRDSVKQGSGQPNLNTDIVKSIPVPHPPLQEQKSINEYVKFHSSKCNLLIEKAQSAIELLKEKRSSLISAAVTGKIDVREEA